MKHYKAILLDADDTLLDFKANERESAISTMKQMEIPEPEKAAALYAETNELLWRAHERGEITKEEVWIRRFAELFRALGVRADGMEAERVYRAFLGSGTQMVPGAWELCETLSKNYALYIVTNGIEETLRARMQNTRLIRWFQDVFVSETVGYSKPSPEYFDYVFSSIPFSRQEALIVGDRLSSDILGGINAGVDTCWYNPQHQKVQNGPEPMYEIHRLYQLIDLLKSTEE